MGIIIPIYPVFSRQAGEAVRIGPDGPDFLFERSFAAPQLAARAVARHMTVGSFADAARAKRAAARAERLQTETPVDTARGADPVSGGESSEDGASDDDDSVDGGTTPGGGRSKWRWRGRRKRDLSARRGSERARERARRDRRTGCNARR